MTNSKIIKNASQGYGYHYASLADFARQGVDIPEMRTVVDEFGEFVEYKDSEGNWQRGARVVQMEMRGMNVAQAYGSALTYARRYTVALAHGIATDDDDAVEHAKSAKTAPVTSEAPKNNDHRIKFDEVWAQVRSIDTVEELENYWKSLNLTEAQANALKKSFARRKTAIEEKE